MSDFKAKMHQIRFRLRWGSLQRSPRPLVGFKGPTSKGRVGEGRYIKGSLLLRKGRGWRRKGRGKEGRGGKGGGEEGRGGKEGEGKEKGGEGRGKDPLVLAYTPLI